MLTKKTAAANHMATDPFSISVENFIQDNNVNVVSAFSALQQAIQAFKELPNGTPKTFIYTGNGLTHMIMPKLMTAGVGKRAALCLVEHAVEVYKDSGIR